MEIPVLCGSCLETCGQLRTSAGLRTMIAITANADAPQYIKKFFNACTLHSPTPDPIAQRVSYRPAWLLLFDKVLSERHAWA